MVGTRVFFIADVRLGSGGAESEREAAASVSVGCANVFSFDLARHYTPLGRLRRADGTVKLDIPSSAISQHTFFQDFPCRNLSGFSAQCLPRQASSSSSEDCTDDRDTDSDAKDGDDAVPLRAVKVEGAGPSDGPVDADSPSLDSQAASEGKLADATDDDDDDDEKGGSHSQRKRHDAGADGEMLTTSMLFFQQAGRLWFFQYDDDSGGTAPVCLGDALRASSATAAPTTTVLADGAVSSQVARFGVHPDGHSMVAVCRDQLFELGLFSGPCVKIPTGIPHVDRVDLAGSDDPSALAMAAAAEFAGGAACPRGHVVDLVTYLPDGRLVLVLSPDTALRSTFSSFHSYELDGAQHSEQIVAVVQAPPNRDSLQVLHVHVINRRRRGADSRPGRAVAPVRALGKIQVVVPCPGDPGVVLLRDDDLQLALLYVPPNQGPSGDAPTGTGTRTASSSAAATLPLKHPAHSHALRRVTKGAFHCDVCRKGGFNATRHARYQCVKGCDWDACGHCVYKAVDHPDIGEEKRAWLAAAGGGDRRKSGGHASADISDRRAGGAASTTTASSAAAAVTAAAAAAAAGVTQQQATPALVTEAVLQKKAFLDDHDHDFFAAAGSPAKRTLGVLVAVCVILDRGEFAEGISDMCFGPARHVRRASATDDTVWSWDAWSSLAREPAPTPTSTPAPTLQASASSASSASPATLPSCEASREAGAQQPEDREPPAKADDKKSLMYWCAYVKDTSPKTSSVLVVNLAPLVGMLHYVYYFGVEPSPNEADLTLLPDAGAGDHELQLAGHWYSDGTSVPCDVTDSSFWNSCPSFDPDGQFLYFLSARYFRPKSDFFGEAMTFQETQRPFLIRLARTVANPFVRNPWVPGQLDADDEDEFDGSDSGTGDTSETTDSEFDSESRDFTDDSDSSSYDGRRGGGRPQRGKPAPSKKPPNASASSTHTRGQHKTGGGGAGGGNRHGGGAPKAKAKKLRAHACLRARCRRTGSSRRTRGAPETHRKTKMIKRQGHGQEQQRRPIAAAHRSPNGKHAPSVVADARGQQMSPASRSLEQHQQEVLKNAQAIDLDGIQSRTHALPHTKVRRYEKLHGLPGGRLLYSRHALSHALPVRRWCLNACRGVVGRCGCLCTCKLIHRHSS